MEKLFDNELNRYRQLVEYRFYVPKEYTDPKPENNLILGEEEPETEEIPGEEMEAGIEDIPAEPQPEPESKDTLEPEIPSPADGEVELDVTQLVDATKEAKDKAEIATSKIDDLINKFEKIEKLSIDIDNISNKIDSLEKEVEKRNPTEVEKLEMRSMYSFPYNLKLTDYWDGKKESRYEPIEKEPEEEKEYVLTKKDVESEYNKTDVEDSFKMDSLYEERFSDIFKGLI